LCQPTEKVGRNNIVFFLLYQITAKVCRKQFYETKMKKKYFFLQSESGASQVGMTWWDSI